MSIRLRLTIYWTAITAVILFAAGLLIMVMFARAMWGTLDAALMEEADTTAAAISHSSAADTSQILQRLSQEKDLGPGRRVRLIAGGHVVFDAGDTGADLPDALAAAESVVDGGQHRYRFAIVPLRVNGEPAIVAGWRRRRAGAAHYRASAKRAAAGHPDYPGAVRCRRLLDGGMGARPG